MKIEDIKKLIYKSIDGNKNGFNVDNENTKILNVEHSIGKYHAYMEILSELDIDEFVKVSQDTKQQVEEMMKFVEKIYK